MPRIKVIEYEESEGRLKAIYDDLIASRGKLASVHKIQSLNPETIVHHMSLYMEIMYGRSPLKRAQREMMAVVVSRFNDCDYCQTHHADALNHFWKDDDRIAQLRKDYRSLDLSETDHLLCVLAEKLTVQPNWDGVDVHLKKIKDLGLEDRAILDATLVIAYFNFVNRIVLSMGLNVEEQEETTGYHYE